ncbi:hypothetical protein K501DRAFT_222396 [Backusella circina FSU 941]|nr:hypothetical protein K501DRAFT_222396 [Backusella circina FSU 941]
MNRFGSVITLGRSLARSRAINTGSPLARARAPQSFTYIPSVTTRRPFHASRPSQVPLIPFAGLIAGFAKTSSIVNIISFTSKTSLTLLPYHLRKGKGASVLMALVMIPLVGSGILVGVGLDMAPNTSRLRLIYMSQEEEEEVMTEAMSIFKNAWGDDRVDDETYIAIWVKEIVDRIAKVTVDDARDPVREYKEGEPIKDYKLHIIWDNETLNALCIGRNIVIYDQIMELLEYDPDRIAVILSHELGHSLQRHTCEKFGMESLLYSIIDMARGFFWMFTEPLGPYINENLNTYLIKFVDAEVTTAYSRPLEVEADLIGLQLMAKAGFDPRAAIDVWEKMDEYTKKMEEDNEEDDGEWTFGNFESRIQSYFDSMYKSWFGSTHPYCSQRAQYMREHMDEAVALYNESIRLNGTHNIKAFEFKTLEDNDDDEEEEVMETITEKERKGYLDWIKSIFSKNPAATTMTA